MNDQQNQQRRGNAGEMQVITKAKELVKHTFKLTENTERYPKKYRFTLVQRLQDRAVDIFNALLEANELDLRDAEEARARGRLGLPYLHNAKRQGGTVQPRIGVKRAGAHAGLHSAALWAMGADNAFVEVSHVTFTA